MTEFQTNVVTVIENWFKKLIQTYTFPQYYEGSVVSVGTNTAVVKVNGQTITLPKREGLTLNINNVIYICCPNGNLANGFIDVVKSW